MSKKYCNEPIAVIGSACRFAGGVNSPAQLWKLLEKPRDVLKEIPDSRFSVDGFYNADGSYHGHNNVRHSYLLDDDIRAFNAQFFGIKPVEARAMDPQQRLLLEVVYEGLESAGLTLQGLKGSDTAVYVGLMCNDYEFLAFRDLNTLPTYQATGAARSIMSNRISYFYDWHGPSVTIDTACSSSLYAVHYAAQALRSGTSRTAVACGTNIILGPENYITESSLKMLSPESRSRMWDEAANGYARGEGVATVVLKTLSAALEDGDHIECLVRETGINQDGATNGITMPSATAQADLIRQTYARAGLDLLGAGKPQYFEAHGTGTPAGDPIEAEAISSSFFRTVNAKTDSVVSGNELHSGKDLYVGSIKTVLGHTEGTAGVASLMKAALALQHSKVPPNMLFNRLSPAVKPFYTNLEVPTIAKDWPVIESGQRRRASVNSFGFGGANAHAILESFDDESRRLNDNAAEDIVLGPYIFSAATEKSLEATLEAYSSFLGENQETVKARDLAWTLRERRSTLSCRLSLPAGSLSELKSSIDSKLKEHREQKKALTTRSSVTNAPRILGVFTGQGAQYARMGAELLEKSALARNTIDELETYLASLPEEDRPSWSLTAELAAAPEASRLDQAALSQPLCTALQIVLVDLLRAAGVEFSGVIGHSSGEIGAAYAAGYLSARDALLIAYYRGLHAARATSPNGAHIQGSMLAVGTSMEDAEDILQEFEGSVTLAACNSSASVTISGDQDAIEELETIFGDENRFRRKLRVDKAYHSSHMLPCSQPHIDSLRRCGVEIREPSKSCTWYSTVYEDWDMRSAEATSKLSNGTYWSDNMVRPVLFYQGLVKVLNADTFDLALEIGPHSALKGPATQTIGEVLQSELPYQGVLTRGSDAVRTFSDALGLLWSYEGAPYVDLEAFEAAATDRTGDYRVVKNLPTYQWDHDQLYWHESRRSRHMRTRKDLVHPLLGHEDPDSASHSRRWRNVLKERELPWLSGHQLQGKTVFPATGYVSVLLEAARRLVDENENARLIEISNFEIHRATAFDDDDAGIETLIAMEDIQRDHECHSIKAKFTFSTAVGKEADSLTRVATAATEIFLGEADTELLPGQQPDPANLVEIAEDRFYNVMGELGYGYSGQFRTLSNLKRKLNAAVGRVGISQIDGYPPLLGHPGTLDCALQAILLAFSYPGDGQLWSLHVPTAIRRIRVNPALCGLAWNDSGSVPIRATTYGLKGDGLLGDAEIFGGDSKHAAFQMEGLRAVPFVGATAADDDKMFVHARWANMSADGDEATKDSSTTSFEQGLVASVERTALFYLRKFVRELPSDHQAYKDPTFASWLRFGRHMTSLADNGRHKHARKEWANDTIEEIMAAAAPYLGTIDMRIIMAIANAMPRVLTGEENILEHLLPTGYLDAYYVNAVGFKQSAEWLGRVVCQMTHRYPNMNILEVGAGTGGATKHMLKHIGKDGFSSFTYTDISTGFFEQAAQVFAPYKSRMMFKALDAGTDPISQGFTAGSYDLIVGWFIIHATPKLEKTLRNLRRLLRPGGHLVVGEWVSQDWTRDGFVFGTMPGWWTGAEEGRTLSPYVAAEHWDEVLRNSGFSGVDVITPEEAFHGTHQAAIFVSQAVDDTVHYLREPTSSPLPEAHAQNLPLEDLVLIGGSSLRSSRLVAELKATLGRFSASVKSFKTLAGVPFDEVSSNTTVVCLSELDKPIFDNLDTVSFDALKHLVASEHSLLWVTRGRRTGDEPARNMGISFVQTASHEVPGLKVQCIDFEGTAKIDARVLADAVLRFQYLSTRSHTTKSADLLWSIEPEIIVDVEGRELIPRLEPDSAANARYNSFKRTVTRDVDVAKSGLVVYKDEKNHYTLHEEHSLSGLVGSAAYSVELRVHQAALAPQQTPVGPRFVTLGEDTVSGTRYVALADKLASTVIVPESAAVGWNPPSEVSDHIQLALISARLSADAILQHTVQGENVAIHNATGLVADAILRAANEKGVEVTFVVSSIREGEDSSISQALNPVVVPPYASEREIRKLLPLGLSRFVSFTRLTRDSALACCLPPHCRVEEVVSPTWAAESPSVSPEANARLGAKLQALVEYVERNHADLRQQASLVQLVDPVGLNEIRAQTELTVLSWSEAAFIPAQARRLDSELLFNRDKTYWLVGLSRDLGLSICDWMISRGARHLVISSRNPKVDPTWIDDCCRQGVTVKIVANDITDPSAVESVYKTICSTLPPLGGIMQGAMVLVDQPIRDMTLEQMQAVLGPKVEGSRNLERVLGSTPLDFFVYLSSMARILCNVGQVNYSAANAFMAGLAVQRRRRGLAASVANISVVAGVGYAQHEKGDDGDNWVKLNGIRRISETDVHQQLAEAIVRGQANGDLSLDYDAEISSGLRIVSRDEQLLPIWIDNPKFARFVSEGLDADASPDASSRGGASIAERLEGAQSMEQVSDVIKESFLAKVRAVLQIDGGDDDALLRTRSNEIGMDSLIAVDLRSWFLKNLSVSIPVLEILSDVSIADLVNQAVAKVPAELIPNVMAGNAASSTQEDSPSSNEAPSTAPSTPISQPSNSALSDPDLVVVTPIETPMEEPSTVLFSQPKGQQPPAPVSATGSVNAQTGVPKLTLERSLKLSPAQSMFWVVHSLLEDKTTLNHVGKYKLTGKLRVNDLKAAVRQLSGRHETLRTIFYEDEDGQVLQGVLAEGNLELEHMSVSSMAEVEEEFDKIKNHVHDLATGRTLRMILLTLSDTESFLIIGVHHVNFDGMSVGVMLRDLEALYSRRYAALSPNVLQYGDFAELQRAAAIDGSWDSDFAFWRREFATLPEPLPLSRARIVARKPLRHYAVHRADIHLDATLAARIRAVAQSKRATAFHFYLATFRVFLERVLFGGESADMCIGIADANRNSLETMTSLGPYVNLLALRFSDSPKTFASSLASARDKTYAALAHATAPFETVLQTLRVDRDTRFAPLFQAFIDYRLGARERQPFADCIVETLRFEPGRTAYDLSLDVFDHQDGGAVISFFGQSALYAENDVRIFASCYEDFVKCFVEYPDIELSSEWQYPDSTLKSALDLGRGPVFHQEWPETLLHKLDQVFPAHEQKTAMVVAGSNQSLTYIELQQRINMISAALLESRVATSQVVAVYQDPGLDWVCSMLAIMKIGAVYLPLDHSTPSARLAMMVTDSHPVAIIVDNAARHTLGIPNVIDISTVPERKPNEVCPTRASSDGPALILYTSGTTGTPKGIVLKHSSFRHEVELSAHFYSLDSSSVVLQQSAFGFDMSVLQMFLALSLGGTLCIAPKEYRADSLAISEAIVAHNVAFTCATPTEYSSWLRYGDTSALRSSRWQGALSGGEPVTHPLLRAFQDLGKEDFCLFQGYGPTETTCCSTKIKLSYQDEQAYASHTTIPAGAPSSNESIYIVDEQMRLLPPGLPGEVVIGGAGVAAGYLNNDGLTRASFLLDHFANYEYGQQGWTVMYRTGDRGRLHPDGTVTIEGRINGDTQVKLHGVRVDLQDIESTVLHSSEGTIIEACATLRHHGNTQSHNDQQAMFIAVHVVCDSKLSLGEAELERHLSSLLSNLPLAQSVRPSVLVPIAKMPLTASSKLDRRAIQALPLSSTLSQAALDKKAVIRATLTETEERLKKLWINVLSHSELAEPAKITPESDFFHVGGSSILLLEVRAQIRQQFDVDVRLMQLFESSTLRAMAQFIEHREVEMKPIDWEAEAQPPHSLTQLLEDRAGAMARGSAMSSSSNPKVIVLTGAAGMVGRQILDGLLANQAVGKIICIAMRRIQERVTSRVLPAPTDRLTYLAGDLRQPRLGLSEVDWAAISAQPDAVIHVGADVSHGKTYKTVRDANVGATAELVRFCLQHPGRRVPLHFVSSAEVAMLGESGRVKSFAEVSVQAVGVVPSQEDAVGEGYASSKWVCERMLENVVAAEPRTGLRVWIHRPSSIMAPSDEDEAAALIGKSDAPLLRSVLFYSRRLRAVPCTDGLLEGMLDLVAVESVARDVIKAVLQGEEVAGQENVTYVHHTGDAELALDRLKEHLEEQEKVEGSSLSLISQPFEVLPLSEWAVRAQAAGMHVLLGAVFENADREKKGLYFPRFIKHRLSVSEAASGSK
ncbi:hypothetical protein F5Y10DRAFT_290905 [Nemania abortiva]|nr:hypothetical protein F5Y10DRAFT_290905 [Nemania abortiva]